MIPAVESPENRTPSQTMPQKERARRWSRPVECFVMSCERRSRAAKAGRGSDSAERYSRFYAEWLGNAATSKTVEAFGCRQLTDALKSNRSICRLKTGSGSIEVFRIDDNIGDTSTRRECRRGNASNEVGAAGFLESFYVDRRARVDSPTQLRSTCAMDPEPGDVKTIFTDRRIGYRNAAAFSTTPQSKIVTGSIG